jgi:hypothetical protein
LVKNELRLIHLHHYQMGRMSSIRQIKQRSSVVQLKIYSVGYLKIDWRINNE